MDTGEVKVYFWRQAAWWDKEKLRPLNCQVWELWTNQAVGAFRESDDWYKCAVVVEEEGHRRWAQALESTLLLPDLGRESVYNNLRPFTVLVLSRRREPPSRWWQLYNVVVDRDDWQELQRVLRRHHYLVTVRASTPA